MSAFELAQLNIARIKAPLDSPVMTDFVAALDRINALAESSTGFVWRLKTDEGDATGLRPIDPQTLVNMSVWVDVASLSAYVYRSEHVAFMRRRREWFERMADAHMVLWWVRAGHRPTVTEGLERLEDLRRHGPSRRAFTFSKPFAPPDAAAADLLPPGEVCPAL